MTKLIVVKIGGASLKDDSLLSPVAQGVSNLISLGHQVVVVHGGGPEINKSLEAAGISWNFIQGQRVTTPEMMAVIDQALSRVNSKIANELKKNGLEVKSLKGNERSLLLSNQLAPELQQVGKVVTVNTSYLSLLLDGQNSVPLICPIGIFENGESCNINADSAAAEISGQMKADELIFLTDTEGVLSPDKKLYKELTSHQLDVLIRDEVISGGMLAKTRSVQNALVQGVSDVLITHAKNAAKLGTNELTGTKCVLLEN